MPNSNLEPVRLPARTGGYTTSRRHAIDGVAGEVDTATLDRYAGQAAAERDRSRQDAATTIAADVTRLNGEIAALRARMAEAPPGVITAAARNRGRRIAHDLDTLAKEMVPS